VLQQSTKRPRRGPACSDTSPTGVDEYRYVWTQLALQVAGLALEQHWALDASQCHQDLRSNPPTAISVASAHGCSTAKAPAGTPLYAARSAPQTATAIGIVEAPAFVCRPERDVTPAEPPPNACLSSNVTATSARTILLRFTARSGKCLDLLLDGHSSIDCTAAIATRARWKSFKGRLGYSCHAVDSTAIFQQQSSVDKLGSPT
jgi:hypothetical protein